MSVPAENIILITIDCLRADHLNGFGYERQTAPCLAGLQQDSVGFTQACAPGPYTPASFPAIITSTYPLMFGGYGQLTAERMPVAVALGRSGWRTAAVHSNPFLSRSFGYHEGFDIFRDNDLSLRRERYERKQHWKRILERLGLLGLGRRIYGIYSEKIRVRSDFRGAYWPAERITDESIEILREGQGKQFVWMHYMDAHQPYHPPARRLEEIGAPVQSEREMLGLWEKSSRLDSNWSVAELQALVDLYDAAIRHVDGEVGRLIDWLKQQDAYDRALIAVTADHGEEFFEHGSFLHRDAKLYEEVVHVPLLVKAPGSEWAGTVVEDPVGLIDVPPSLLDLGGVEPESGFIGRSLRRFWEREPGDREEETVISECFNGPLNTDDLRGDGSRLFACRKGAWKLIYHEKDGKTELYNLMEDAGERKDLGVSHPDRVADFRDEVERHIAFLDETGRNPADGSRSINPSEDDEMLRKRLRMLGYL